MIELAPKDTYNVVYEYDQHANDAAYDIVASAGVIGTHVDAIGMQSLLSKVRVGGMLVFSCKACSWQQDGFVDVLSAMSSWSYSVLFGPAPLNQDMPDQHHVIVE